MKRFISLASVCLAAGLVILSCGNKNNEPGGGGGTGTPQLGVEVKDAPQDGYQIPQGQTLLIELAVVANPTSPESYTITLAANSGLVTTYNAKNGTAYPALPADCYTFTANQVILTRYGARSSAASLRLGGPSCEVGKTYLLPVVIDGVSGGTNFQAPDEKAAYILVSITEPQMAGSGTAADPYQIASAQDMASIDKLLKDGQTIYFKQTADIDFAGFITEQNPWKAINPSQATEDDTADPAEARVLVYDGNNKKISNFNGGGAIFAILVGSVKDLTIEKADIDCAAKNLGGVLAAAVGTSQTASNVVLKNVHVKDSKINNDYQRSGGLIAWLKGGIVEDCDAECEVTSTNPQAGGLIGRIDAGTVKNCYATGNISAGYYSGGLVGFATTATLENCYATGNVANTAGGNYARVGGFLGQAGGNLTVSKCYSTGNATGSKAHMAGGFIGVLAGENAIVNIDRCYATGDALIEVDPDSGNWAHVGAFVGTINAAGQKVTISNCYCTGAIATRRYSGGFVGSIFSSPATLTVSNSYTTSDISGVLVKDGLKADGSYWANTDAPEARVGYRHRTGLLIGCADKWNEGTTISCSGFVAWRSNAWYDDPENPTVKTGEFDFSYINYNNSDFAVPVTGNYLGNAGTVSQQAQALGWDASIWDLSGSLPRLK